MHGARRVGGLSGNIWLRERASPAHSLHASRLWFTPVPPPPTLCAHTLPLQAERERGEGQTTLSRQPQVRLPNYYAAPHTWAPSSSMTALSATSLASDPLPRLLMSRKRPSSLSPDTEPHSLPLKKRLHPTTHIAPPDDPHLLSPVDFSLPNRTRAKASPSKFSHTDTESPTSEHSMEAPRPLDLSTDKSPVKPLPFPVWNPLLLNPLANPLFNPFLSPNPDLLKLLLAAAAPSGDPPPRDPKPEPQDPSPSEDSKIINPATGNKVRRNYKNMTRERRMEANARERTRVHTIGAAFDALQGLVPSLAPDQKLSKLSILRIAMSGRDYSSEQCGYSVGECIEMLNETIAQEAKLRRLDRR